MSKNKKSKTQESTIEEKCPRCGSKNFAIDKGPHQKRYCTASGCKHIWPAMTKTELELHHFKEENIKIKGENDFLRDRVSELEKHILS